MEINEINVNVNSCIRCGEDHPNLSFTPLDNAADVYKWWCMCPVKEQPIILRVADPSHL